LTGGRDRITLDALRFIFSKLKWSQDQGIEATSLLCEADHGTVLGVLELLVEAGFIKRGKSDGRYYNVKV
jgi:DNA-binding IclR family transcriptional regulator